MKQKKALQLSKMLPRKTAQHSSKSHPKFKFSLKMKNSLQAQLTATFGLIISLLIIFIILFNFSLKNLQQVYEDILDYKENTTECLLEIETDAAQIESNMSMLTNKIFASNTTERKTKIQSLLTRMQSLIAQYNEYTQSETYAEVAYDTSDYAFSIDLESSLNTVQTIKEQIFSTISIGDNSELSSAFEKYETAQEEFNTKLTELIDANNNVIDQNIQILKHQINRTLVILVLLCAIFIIISVIISYFILKKIVTRIKTFRDFSSSIRSGNLTNRMNVSVRDELGLLAEDLNESIATIESMMKAIFDASATMSSVVGTCTDEIEKLNSSIQETAAVSEELSAQFETTAASSSMMNELSETISSDINTVSTKANESGMLADEMVTKLHTMFAETQESQEQMNDMIHKLKSELDISLEQAKSVEKIQELSAAILSITSQTNLLSLNASIEAARAGDAGRGFSVVADEIRNLADTSKQAVEEIQKVTTLVIASVNGLMKSSNDMMDFVRNHMATNFSHILSSVEASANDIIHVDEVAIALNDLAGHASSSTETITETIHSVADSTVEGAKATETVAQNISEVTASVDTIVNQINRAKDCSEQLVEACSHFTITK